MVVLASVDNVKVKRSALIVVMMAASAVGLSPYALYVDRPLVLVAFSLGTVGSAAWLLRAATTRRMDQPTLLEFAVAFVAATSVTATVAFAGVMFHAGAYWLARGAVLLASRFDYALAVDPRAFAFWASLVIVALAGLGNVGLTLERFRRQIYPQTAGLQPDLRTFAQFQRTRARLLLLGEALLIAVGLFVAVVVPEWRSSWWFNVGAAWALIVLGTPLQRLGVHTDLSGAAVNAIELVSELFESANYRVVRSPRTGREDLDPLLVDAPDLLCVGQERVFAVEVKVGQERSQTAPWSGLDDLLSATWALSQYFESREGLHPRAVEPLVVSVGADTPSAVAMYERRGLISVLRLKDLRILEQLRKTPDKNAREAKARELVDSSISSRLVATTS